MQEGVKLTCFGKERLIDTTKVYFAMEILLPHGRDLMLVDDDVDLHFLISLYLKRTPDVDARLISMYSGQQCLDWFDKVKRTKENLPGVILMDINMPRVSGFDCVHKIREREEFRKIPIIIMLSSSSDAGDIRRAMKSGADQYLEKHLAVGNISFRSV